MKIGYKFDEYKNNVSNVDAIDVKFIHIAPWDLIWMFLGTKSVLYMGRVAKRFCGGKSTKFAFLVGIVKFRFEIDPSCIMLTVFHVNILGICVVLNHFELSLQ
ncbi:hypothetical protein ACOSQ3_031015 [Xanthoceras sorbifolium]